MKDNRYAGTPCPRGHVERYKHSGNCVKCQAIRARKHRQNKPAVVRAIARASYAKTRTSAIKRADTLWQSCKRRAEQQDVPFTLTKEWVREKLKAGVCEATGLLFVYAHGPRVARSPSIDRRVAKHGYTSENCRVIVWALNAAIGTWGEDTLREVMAAWK